MSADIMKKEFWVVFYLQGWEELASYTLRGTFAGECMATRELLAYEHGVKVEDISVVIEQRLTRGGEPWEEVKHDI